jgi:hypothetical protein
LSDLVSRLSHTSNLQRGSEKCMFEKLMNNTQGDGELDLISTQSDSGGRGISSHVEWAGTDIGLDPELYAENSSADC